MNALTQLRTLLKEKFADAHQFDPDSTLSKTEEPTFSTGVECLDVFPLKKGGIHEIVGEAAASGSTWLLDQMIRAQSAHLALIDGRDTFDPAETRNHCQQLLWVRCRNTDEAMKAADWLLRDGNLPLILLDLQLNQPEELRKIPISNWYRLRNLAEETGSTLLVFTAGKLLPNATLRLRLQRRFNLDSLDEERRLLVPAPVQERGKQAAPNLPQLAHAG